ncbi:MAG: hypothetical protein AB9883_03125 [Acidaminococcaceae bacterium]
MKKRRILLFLMLFLFMFANTALATTWVFYDFFDEGKSYTDADTVYRSGNTLYFWELHIYDEYAHDQRYIGYRVTMRYEVQLTSPRKMRELEYHVYDSKLKEVDYSTTPTVWWTVNSGSFDDGLIDLALHYAR